jgi:hypothetical protein
MPALHNLLEPIDLIRHFLAAPPQGFSALDLAAGVPAFSTPFDLFTTLDPVIRRKLDALPFARWWKRLLRPQTCFVGTTVSEYALLPHSMSPEVFVRHLVDEIAPRYPLLIVKDIPTDAVLVGNAAYTYSRLLADACSKDGFELVEGQALAYVPLDFVSIDEFLARMSRSRRKDIKRKLKAVSTLEIEAIPTGDVVFNDVGVLARFYELYLNVYRQSEIHFDLLSADFFRMLLQDASARGIVFVYRASGVMIGYNICFIHDNALVDKYVGFLYPQAREHNLYTVSWFHNLEYILAHGLRYYIAGWTDPEIKRYLGANFTVTEHAVHVRNPLLKNILRSFKCHFETDRRWRAAHAADADS